MGRMNGIDGERQRFRCPGCRKTFFFWRPAALPGAKVKCQFCRTEFEDEVAKRPPAPKPAEAPPAAPAAS